MPINDISSSGSSPLVLYTHSTLSLRLECSYINENSNMPVGPVRKLWDKSKDMSDEFYINADCNILN